MGKGLRDWLAMHLPARLFYGPSTVPVYTKTVGGTLLRLITMSRFPTLVNCRMRLVIALVDAWR